VTFLFTDIEGSTRLWEEHPEAMRRALAHHDELLRSAIEGHGGYVFQTAGDGMAAAFQRSADAVTAAVDAQGALLAERWPEGAVIRVRMGLHTGEADERDGDYLGPPLNRAARLMALGHGGQVLCSAATAGLLGAEAMLLDLGEQRLRDLSAPQRVFQLGDGRFPPLRSVDAFPGNLPALLTSFIGRDDELAFVAKALDGSRLVTLTGTGGVGKTRLALQVAADVLPSFPDGAWLCELAAASDRDSMLQVVAIALGFTPRQGVALAHGIAEFIGGKRALLILDNCEHLLDASASLAATLLAGCPNARVLATSREPLEVEGERVNRIRSLAAPDAGAPAEELVRVDAARLFLDRAEAAGVELNVAASAGAIGEICRRLDGIPLAIELAAARVIALSPAEIAAHLDERFRLLTGGRRAAVERHQTLRATVDWSYSLLGETERRVFDRLGVFPATFDAAAAKAVAAGDDIEDWDVVDALTGLVAKSMLVADPSLEGTTRFQMLETLRHYARERLDASGSSDDRRRRHACHFAGLAEQVGAGLKTPQDHLWRERTLVELDNFRAAVFWGLDSHRDADAELALRIIAYLSISGDWNWNGVAVGAWAEQAVECARSGDPRYRGLIIATAAANAFYRGDFALGRSLFPEALRDGLVEGCPFPTMLYATAGLFAQPDDLPALLADGLQALERVHADEWEFAALRSGVAAMAAIVGKFDLAAAEAASALATARRINSGYIMAMALYAIGLAGSQTRPDAALIALDEHIAIVRAGPAVFSLLPRCLALAAQIRAAGGDLPEALDELRQAIDTAHSTGDRPAMAFTLARGVSVMRYGDPTTAAVLSGVVSNGALAQFAVLTWERDWFQHVVEEIRAVLGTQPCEQASAEGAALSYDDALAVATDAIDHLSRGDRV
jgi:predicted ATPase